MKILLVDDESLIRIGIKSCIKNLDKHEVFECSNGEEAIRLIRQHHPDLVFTDIKMPVMNGVELIKKAGSMNLKTIFIVLSCFDDFEYVKQSLQYGARDYILKHKLDIQEMTKLIESVENEISNSSIRNDNNHSRSKTFLGSLVNGVTFSADEIKLNIQNQNLRLSEKSTIIGFLEITRNANINPVEQDLSVFNLSVTNIVDELMSKYKNGEIIHNDNDLFFFILGSKHSSQNTILQETTVMFRAIESALEKYMGVSCRFVVIQNICLENMQSGLSRLRRLYDISFFYPDEFIVSEQNKPLDITDNVFDFNPLMSQYIDTINHSDKSDLQKKLSEMFDIVIIKFHYNKHYVKLFFEIFLHTYIANCRKDYLLSFNGFKEYDTHYYNIIACKNVNELKIIVNSMLQKVIEDNVDAANNTIVTKIINHIKENYRCDLTLEMIAHTFRFNSSYISRLFKEQTSRNFTEYLMLIRMKEAKRLLRSTNLTIKKISEACGYNNPQYFSTIFKKLVHLSPLEYRHEMILYSSGDIHEEIL